MPPPMVYIPPIAVIPEMALVTAISGECSAGTTPHTTCAPRVSRRAALVSHDAQATETWIVAFSSIQTRASGLWLMLVVPGSGRSFAIRS
eukprot:3272348-Pleurochrysis_carterae.AAC.2